MTTQDVRRKFLRYFEQKDHRIVPSSPVVPRDDPTLLFVNAGMNQFKDVFLGSSKRDYSRATTCQKCIRAGGKHNDLENVGHTSRHLTLFEMLGNFSFGDYFKKDAIDFAWEVSTQIYGFDPEKIWPTVFTDDDEALHLWEKYLPARRITRFGAADNFWSMGDTGPCGPCSELLFDRGPRYGSATCPAEDTKGERYIEFWNLVFMQFNRSLDGQLAPLPKQSVDTGSGLERVMALRGGFDSVFETDILRHLIARVETMTCQTYLPGTAQAPAFQVIADHLRSLSFSIADGAQPSNIERGYVLRKILRRAVRYGRTLGLEQPFLAHLLPALIDVMGTDYPELASSQSRIADILTLEEEAFLRTLHRGGNMLSNIMASAREHRRISGDDAFKLKDTYGLPLEEIVLMARDADLIVDEERFRQLEQEAKQRSRSAHKTTHQAVAKGPYEALVAKVGSSRFVGYVDSEALGQVIALLVDGVEKEALEEGEEGMVILDQTPFYAESGGQIGDTGLLQGTSATFEVSDCRSPFPGMIAHIGTVTRGRMRRGDALTARIDLTRRQKIANNHTATHLLHWALQRVLGDHVRQAGSVVDPSRLRFDFNHHKAVSPEEIRQIEDLVNSKVRENRSVQTYELPFAEVQKERTIKQFFGDKYGDLVRVVDIDYSKELCGGTHTSAVGTIGLFRIAREGSVAAGVRRIEAVTGAEAEHFARSHEEALQAIAELVKSTPAQLFDKVTALLDESKNLQQAIKIQQQAALGDQAEKLLKQSTTSHGVSYLVLEVKIAPKELRILADALVDKMPSGALVVGAAEDSTCQLIARVTPDLVSRGLHASALIKAIAPLVGGGGGGKPDSAQAGGKEAAGLPAALEKSKQLIAEWSSKNS